MNNIRNSLKRILCFIAIVSILTSCMLFNDNKAKPIVAVISDTIGRHTNCRPLALNDNSKVILLCSQFSPDASSTHVLGIWDSKSNKSTSLEISEAVDFNNKTILDFSSDEKILLKESEEKTLFSTIFNKQYAKINIDGDNYLQLSLSKNGKYLAGNFYDHGNKQNILTYIDESQIPQNYTSKSELRFTSAGISNEGELVGDSYVETDLGAKYYVTYAKKDMVENIEIEREAGCSYYTAASNSKNDVLIVGNCNDSYLGGKNMITKIYLKERDKDLEQIHEYKNSETFEVVFMNDNNSLLYEIATPNEDTVSPDMKRKIYYYHRDRGLRDVTEKLESLMSAKELNIRFVNNSEETVLEKINGNGRLEYLLVDLKKIN